MVRSALLLASAFPELRGQAVALSEQLNDLLRVKDSIRIDKYFSQNAHSVQRMLR
jgi:hypothetical protein